ncbi:MAG: hypothetical protein KGD64_06100 [Candidatus Heimdallarchaeota archaeon]|nr:hypothetical protein [Candidatus Heimdallarchaeota archaeon]
MNVNTYTKSRLKKHGLPSKPPLLRFTIIDLSGVTVYHRSFVSEVLDEVLFSGFSAAMIAFSRELGTQLYCIKMEGVDYYFKTRGDFIFVVGMYPRVRSPSAKRFLRLVEKDVNWEEIDSYLNKAVHFQTEEFEKKVEQTIFDFQIRFKHIIRE